MVTRTQTQLICSKKCRQSEDDGTKKSTVGAHSTCEHHQEYDEGGHEFPENHDVGTSCEACIRRQIEQCANFTSNYINCLDKMCTKSAALTRRLGKTIPAAFGGRVEGKNTCDLMFEQWFPRTFSFH